MDPFVWDEAKSAENLKARGFGFEIVYQIDWATVRFREDERFAYAERRLLAFARLNDRPYYIVLAPRDGTIRVLSARRMHEKEARRNGI